MFKRLIVALLYAFGITLSLAPIPAIAGDGASTPADDIICRRIYGTPEWTRRCAPQRPDESYEAYCRRISGTDEWTRRCAPQRPDERFDRYCRRVFGTPEWTRRCLPQRPDESREHYCRRIYGTDEWTRRCLRLLTPTPAVRPTEIVVRPTLARPVEATLAPVNPTRP